MTPSPHPIQSLHNSQHLRKEEEPEVAFGSLSSWIYKTPTLPHSRTQNIQHTCLEMREEHPPNCCPPLKDVRGLSWGKSLMETSHALSHSLPPDSSAAGRALCLLLTLQQEDQGRGERVPSPFSVGNRGPWGLRDRPRVIKHEKNQRALEPSPGQPYYSLRRLLQWGPLNRDRSQHSDPKPHLHINALWSVK